MRTRAWAPLVGLGIVASLIAVPAFGAYEFYVQVKGAKQGKLKGEAPREAHKEKIMGISFHYSVRSPRDSATGQASGKRSHGPVTFVKEWGAATPQLFQALITNENLENVTFEFPRTNANGEEEISHVIRLTNAAISAINQRVLPPIEALNPNKINKAPTGNPHEEISFTFQRIEIENKIGKTMAVDDGSSR